jgi:hypothetical protein
LGVVVFVGFGNTVVWVNDDLEPSFAGASLIRDANDYPSPCWNAWVNLTF